VDGDAGVTGLDGAAQEPEAGAVSTPEPVAVVPDGVDARKEALKALEQGKWARAAEMAQAAISAHPEDATLYLYQGTALQEMGRRGDAKAVFQKCVEQAKRGPIHECRMFSK
jgi:Flp pilus assembly protein TadD